jgi:hypothetical protein
MSGFQPVIRWLILLYLLEETAMVDDRLKASHG